VNNSEMDFSANLRRLREAAGLTQTELATLCGWTQTRLSNYEIPRDRKGARTPDVDDAAVLAKALNVPIQHLYGDTSQSMKLDPETMATALKLTEAMEYGRPKGDFFTWAETLIFCYKRVSEGGQHKLVDQIIEPPTEGRTTKGENDGDRRYTEGPVSGRKRR
jgi:transcriptional regulator with XRE-family HTH domain